MVENPNSKSSKRLPGLVRRRNNCRAYVTGNAEDPMIKARSDIQEFVATLSHCPLLLLAARENKYSILTRRPRSLTLLARSARST